MMSFGTIVCPKCNCGNVTQTGNTEILRCPDCKREFRLVEVQKNPWYDSPDIRKIVNIEEVE